MTGADPGFVERGGGAGLIRGKGGGAHRERHRRKAYARGVR